MMLPYPTKGFFQHPADEVLAEIFQEMEKRNWSVPGIQCTHDRGQIETIFGNNFRLWFARRSHQYIYFAAIKMVINRKDLTVYRAPVRSTLKVYTGTDWGADRLWFQTSGKVNAKGNNLPRRYIVYEDRDGTMIINESDGHEYGLQPGDQAQYSTVDIYTEFSDWLKTNVLNYIKAQK